jgi:hypothetical protein
LRSPSGEEVDRVDRYRGEPLHPLQRGEDEVGAAVGGGTLHAVGEAAVVAEGEALRRDWPSGATPEEVRQPEAVGLW